MDDNTEFKILDQKSIIHILIGGEHTDKNKIEFMPYLSGPQIIEISKLFNLIQNDGESRWKYMSKLLNHCIENKTINKLLTYLFNKEQFNEKKEKYDEIVKKAINDINNILNTANKKLEKIDDSFYIMEVSEKSIKKINNIEFIDFNYIKKLESKALIDLEKNNYGAVVTKSRTLLEEIFCYGIEKKNMDPQTNKGDINKLFSEFRQIYKMDEDKNLGERIRKLISGLYSIVSAIGEIRNHNSDSHGIGTQRVGILEHHARLVLNSSIIISEYMISIIENDRKN